MGFCKCAELLPFHASDAALYLPQDHLRNVAGRRAKLDYGIRRIEQPYALVFIAVKYSGGVDAQAHQDRMGNAGHELKHKGRAYLVIAHIRECAVVRRFEKLLVVIAVVVRHGVDGYAQYGGSHIGVLRASVPEMVLQLLNDLRRVLGFCLPEPKRDIVTCVGVGRIEYIPQRGPVPAVVDERDALCAPVHPTSEFAVPKLDGSTGFCIRSLRMNQDLFMERVLIKPCGGIEKAFPVVNGLRKPLRCLTRKLGYVLQFCCHSCTSLSPRLVAFLCALRLYAFRNVFYLAVYPAPIIRICRFL